MLVSFIRKISITEQRAAFAIAKKRRLFIPKIFSFGSANSDLLLMRPAIENMREISIPTPIKMR